MPTYQPTPDEQGLIRELEEFRAAIKQWSESSRPEDRERLRSFINRRLEGVQEIVRLAGCRHTLTIGPPPAVGGLVMQNADPFNYIFERVYGASLHASVYDMLDQAIGVIESGRFEERRTRLMKASGPMGPISGRRVFLVHGHDESARETAARFIEKLSLEPIILHEQPSSGRTIIEKVEQYSEVAFALVLLTPDDVGAKNGSEQALLPRARQNVILELGYFIGKLGRTHVAALVKGESERPSDYDGVVYISMDPAGAWKMLLARELKAAGLNVDLNDAV
jgi:predicted nucleotide-binding protein